MSRWFTAPRPRNGSVNGDEADRAKNESETALRRQKARGHEVSFIVSALKQIREFDDLPDLFRRTS